MMQIQARSTSASVEGGNVPTARLVPLRRERDFTRAEQERAGLEPTDAELAAVSAAGDVTPDNDGTEHHQARDWSADAFGTYLHDLGSVALLSPDEELRLAQRSMAGDLDARRRLIEANLRLVIATVRHYNRSGVPLSDLVQEGNLGLIHAAERFDWRRGCRFSTYATWWILQAVRRAVKGQSQLIRIPERMMDRVHKMRRVAASLAQETGNDPTPAQIAARAGISIEEVDQLLRVIEQPLSLDVSVGEDSTGSYSETLVDLEVEPPEDSAVQRLLGEALRRALLRLTPQERAVLTLRYGLGDGCCRTCSQVSRQLGISRQRATQVEVTGVSKLRGALRSWSTPPALERSRITGPCVTSTILSASCTVRSAAAATAISAGGV
jgi:RNA polymerase primary sigma factor